MIGKRSSGMAMSSMALTALICAVTLLATPAPSHARPATPPAAPPAEPTPVSPRSLEDVRKDINRLYREAALATEAYNAAEEKAKKQSKDIVKLAHAVVRGQEKLDRLKARAGAAARAQYRGGGMPAEAQLMLSDDPQQFLRGARQVRQGQHATVGVLAELTRTQDDLKTYSADASSHWKKLDGLSKKKAAAAKEIKKKIAAAEKLESRLKKEERERLRKLEEQAARERQKAWLASGALHGGGGSGSGATGQGKKAIQYATAQIGKPYEWGAEGPGSYDCSGLTSQAWAAAGQGIPRTSQEQWKRLPRVDVAEMRPGDLIIYWKDASHVGMYLGDGAMVHSPRPGRHVTKAGAGSMPILGVVRPGG
ncbi:C40 family peptidase [Streptomyces apocyni]|uniref:C40 family peptidase n=1 Tax=Streptomyces apocyni TaxID=2654677 RepID=UPI001E61CF34|nr:C40 family peptidase [Streptomyces apocyni]